MIGVVVVTHGQLATELVNAAETIVGDLLSGQYNSPVRIVAFNTLEHWSEDVSPDIAAEIQLRCDIDGVPVPEHLTDFVQTRIHPVRQLALRLA